VHWGKPLLLMGLLIVGSCGFSLGAELKIFDWNAPVTTANKGFPWAEPPAAAVNGDWTTPIDYARGTLYYRVIIRSQPSAQTMKLQFCMWQNGEGGEKKELEVCGPLKTVEGTAGFVATWQVKMEEQWMKNDTPLDYTRERITYGVAIKNRSGLAVSSYSGWNWNGENPALWYPLDMRFTVVLVSAGESFSGWQNYSDLSAVTNKTISPTPAAHSLLKLGAQTIALDVDPSQIRTLALYTLQGQLVVAVTLINGDQLAAQVNKLARGCYHLVVGLHGGRMVPLRVMLK
jgi:hypothetical protein